MNSRIPLRTGLRLFTLVFAVTALKPLFAQNAQSEPVAVLEVGGAASRSITEHNSSFGPTVAIEATPVEGWLEFEAGVTPLFRQHSMEWSLDFLLKKPWTLSARNEFMLGIGPEWIHSNSNGQKTDSAALEIAPDFMFWRAKHHKWGWYLEPSYEYKLGFAHEHSFAITAGLLFGIGSARNR